MAASSSPGWFHRTAASQHTFDSVPMHRWERIGNARGVYILDIMMKVGLEFNVTFTHLQEFTRIYTCLHQHITPPSQSEGDAQAFTSAYLFTFRANASFAPRD